jgi:hypothetical protein
MPEGEEEDEEQDRAHAEHPRILVVVAVAT